VHENEEADTGSEREPPRSRGRKTKRHDASTEEATTRKSQGHKKISRTWEENVRSMPRSIQPPRTVFRMDLPSRYFLQPPDIHNG